MFIEGKLFVKQENSVIILIIQRSKFQINSLMQKCTVPCIQSTVVLSWKNHLQCFICIHCLVSTETANNLLIIAMDDDSDFMITYTHVEYDEEQDHQFMSVRTSKCAVTNQSQLFSQCLSALDLSVPYHAGESMV